MKPFARLMAAREFRLTGTRSTAHARPAIDLLKHPANLPACRRSHWNIIRVAFTCPASVFGLIRIGPSQGLYS